MRSFRLPWHERTGLTYVACVSRPALADVDFEQGDARYLEQQHRHEYRARKTPPCTGGEAKQAEVHPAKPPSFMDVPEMLVNLVGAPGERVQYLKVKVVLELKEDKQIDAIKPTLPRITDIFQTYLRELRPIDLNGSAGMFRLKEELTRRVNVAVAPNAVNAVLFKEIVIQ